MEIATSQTSFCGAMRSRRIVGQGCSWPKYKRSMGNCVHAVDDRGAERGYCQSGREQYDAMFWRRWKLRWRIVRGADMARGAFARLISERTHHTEPRQNKEKGCV